MRSSRMLATAEAAGLPVVLGHGFGLDPSTTAEIMLGATSRNIVPGLECVGPLKVVDTVATTRLDISTGGVDLPPGPGLGIELDDFDYAPFAEEGGLGRVRRVFGKELGEVLSELNRELVA